MKTLFLDFDGVLHATNGRAFVHVPTRHTPTENNVATGTELWRERLLSIGTLAKIT